MANITQAVFNLLETRICQLGLDFLSSQVLNSAYS